MRTNTDAVYFHIHKFQTPIAVLVGTCIAKLAKGEANGPDVC